MNVRERLQALLDGKKIRMRDWPEKEYLDINSNTFITIGTLLNSLMSWELYEEDTQKIQLKPQDVGKRVRLKDGQVSLLLHSADCMWIGYARYKERLGQMVWDNRGKSSVHEADIVEILD